MLVYCGASRAPCSGHLHQPVAIGTSPVSKVCICVRVLVRVLLGQQAGPVRFTVDGLAAAVFTPFHTDGSLNLATVAKKPVSPIAHSTLHDRHKQMNRRSHTTASLAADGVGAVFCCGTTGESLSLTVDERVALAAAWCVVSLPVFVLQCSHDIVR